MDPLTIAILVMALSFLSGVLRIWAYLKPKSILIDNQKGINQNHAKPIGPPEGHPFLTGTKNMSPQIVVNTFNHDLYFTPSQFSHSPFPKMSQKQD